MEAEHGPRRDADPLARDGASTMQAERHGPSITTRSPDCFTRRKSEIVADRAAAAARIRTSAAGRTS